MRAPWLALAAIALPLPLSAQVAFGHRERVERVEAGLIVEGDENGRHQILDRMRHYNVPGVSVAVMNEGEIVWARGYGVKRAGSDEPVTPSTLFQAASISKPVAALVVHQLVEEGRLDLDRDVNEYLTTWKLPANEWTERAPVTLRRILSHTAGLTQHGFPGYERGSPIPSVPEILDGSGAANTGPVRADTLPGARWRYSGGGYTVVQLLLEDVTGTPFPELARDLVLEPTGLQLSTYEQPLPRGRWDETATAHDREGRPIEGDWHVYPEMAAAGLWTTPFELLRLADDVQEAWSGQVGRLLEPATAQEVLTPVANGYGLGFSAEDGPGARFGHGGSNAGFKATLTVFKEGGRGVAVMTNGDRGAALAQEIVRAVFAEYGWTEGGGE